MGDGCLLKWFSKPLIQCSRYEGREQFDRQGRGEKNVEANEQKTKIDGDG